MYEVKGQLTGIPIMVDMVCKTTAYLSFPHYISIAGGGLEGGSVWLSKNWE